MSRIERIGPHVLHLGDCREILPTLGKVGAVVTDPPYGISYLHSDGGGHVTGRNGAAKRNISAIVGDEVPFDPALFLGFECVFWGANHFAQRLPHGRWLVWNKLGGFEPFGDSFSDVEIAWHSERGADRMFSLLWKGVRQDEKIDNGRRYHPTMKPIGLMRWCIEQLKGDAHTILDPFMGSGTTGVACAKMGRTFIGIEIDERYFDIACRRVEAAMNQPDLFIPQPKAKAEQLNLLTEDA